MTHKTFVLTVTCDGVGNPINFNIINPRGDYKSGSRADNEKKKALDKCFDDLRDSIRKWNANNPEDKFPSNDDK